MRYDVPVFFQKLTQGEYDSATGNYEDDTVDEEMRRAAVIDTGANTMKIVYGDVKEGSLTIQLQNHYNKPFDQIRIEKTVYKVDFSRKLRRKQTFVVSEVK